MKWIPPRIEVQSENLIPSCMSQTQSLKKAHVSSTTTTTATPSPSLTSRLRFSQKSLCLVYFSVFCCFELSRNGAFVSLRPPCCNEFCGNKRTFVLKLRTLSSEHCTSKLGHAGVLRGGIPLLSLSFFPWYLTGMRALWIPPTPPRRPSIPGSLEAASTSSCGCRSLAPLWCKHRLLWSASPRSNRQ